MLIQIADDFIESVTAFSCDLAKHRKSDTLEARDVALHLGMFIQSSGLSRILYLSCSNFSSSPERNWNIKVPGYSNTEDLKPFKKTAVPEAHKQRLALIKKTQNARAASGVKK